MNNRQKQAPEDDLGNRVIAVVVAPLVGFAIGNIVYLLIGNMPLLVAGSAMFAASYAAVELYRREVFTRVCAYLEQ
jgi:hypothetical protein